MRSDNSWPNRLPMPLSSRFGMFAATALLAAWAGSPASADTPTADTGALEQIVVTAQRRVENLQDVPMSIQTFSQEKLDQQGLRSIDDLSRLTPGITFMRNGMSDSGNYNDEDSDISIRGIDSTAGASTTGIYVDDTPIQTRHLQFGTVNPFPALFDVERVEVLKGPQGTLFGAGSEGGTIRFITPEPSLTTYQVYSRAEFGQIDGGGQNYEAGLAVGGPIIADVLGFRASLSYREDGGWVNRVNYTAPPPRRTPTGMTRRRPG
jgi:iron complex outermembrane recepter protein